MAVNKTQAPARCKAYDAAAPKLAKIEPKNLPGR
jgi:hypothetical protein